MWFLMLVLLGVASAQSFNEQAQTLCGRELAKAHWLYCYGFDADPGAGRDTVPWFPAEANAAVASALKVPERFAHRARRTADAVSLVQACCLQPCQISDLLSHC